MNKKPFLILISILFLISHPANAAYMANVYPEKIADTIKQDLTQYLSTYDIPFLITADLNNDSKDEKVTIYRQWDGEGWYSDDQWYIICIFDETGNLLLKKDISYFQEVKGFVVKDTDGDGLKEVIISLEGAQCWDAKTQVYGWKEGSYRLMEELRT